MWVESTELMNTPLEPGQGVEDLLPYARPVPAIADRRAAAVNGWTALPASARAQHAHDARNLSSVIHPPRTAPSAYAAGLPSALHSRANT